MVMRVPECLSYIDSITCANRASFSRSTGAAHCLHTRVKYAHKIRWKELENANLMTWILYAECRWSLLWGTDTHRTAGNHMFWKQIRDVEQCRELNRSHTKKESAVAQYVSEFRFRMKSHAQELTVNVVPNFIEWCFIPIADTHDSFRVLEQICGL